MMGVFVQLNEDSPLAEAKPVGYVIQENGCWDWVGGSNGNGYGTWHHTYGHRLMYERTNGPIPKGKEIDHLCRNRGCVNPAHLEAVDHRTNLLRGDTITATAVAVTHCPEGHPYAGRNMRITKAGTRKCRECHAARNWKGRSPRTTAFVPEPRGTAPQGAPNA